MYRFTLILTAMVTAGGSARLKLANANRVLNRSTGILLIKTAGAALILVVLVHLVEVDQLVATAQAARGEWLLAALLLVPLNLLLEGTSWHLLVRHEVPEARWTASQASLLAGHALGLATPARLGEYAGRAYALGHGDRLTLMALVFTDHLFAKTCGILAGLVALWYFLAAVAPAPAMLWWGVAAYGVVAALALLVFLLFPQQAYRLLSRLTSSERWRRRIRFLTTLRPATTARLFGLALLRYGVYTTQFVLLLHAFTPSLMLFTAYSGVALVFFAKFLLPAVTLLDLGIREGAAVFFLGHLGVPEAAAFNAALLLFCINLLLPALVGLPFVYRLRLRAAEAPAAPANP